MGSLAEFCLLRIFLCQVKKQVAADFLAAKEETQASHLTPGWSFVLLDRPPPGPQTPPGTPPEIPPGTLTESPNLPAGPATPNTWLEGGTPPPSPAPSAPSSPAQPGPSKLPAPTTPLTPPGPNNLPAPTTPLPGTPPELVLLEDSGEETAQLPSLTGLPRVTTQSNWGVPNESLRFLGCA